MWRHGQQILSDDTQSLSHDPGRSALAMAIGAGRIAVGAAFLAKPVESVRFLGVDTGTATRLAWLARMTAARDAALGVGTLVSAITGRGTAGWLLAGAACDATDAAAITAALRRRQVAALPALATALVAFAAAATAVSDIYRHRACAPAAN